MYMRSNGSDRHSGISNSLAVRSLTRVHALVRELILADPSTDIEVHIAPGTYRSTMYYDYRAKWPSNDTMQHATITFMPAPAAPALSIPSSSSSSSLPASPPWPVTFDGCNTAAGPCPGGTFFDMFFSVPRADGAPRATNMVFQGLHMTNFSQGIVFTGCKVIRGHCPNSNISHHEHNLNGPSYSLSSNTIRDCWFERMGNVFNTSLCPCCGAVATVHTHHSLFTGNLFTDVVGIQRGVWPSGAKKPDPGWYAAEHMHAFYLSNNSTRNNITNNIIVRAMGDPIRIRDSSSFNQITGNTFSQAGAESAFEEWFCDLRVDKKVCANHTAQCPSWQNNFSNNLLDGNFACGPLTVACLCQPNEDYCGAPPHNGARVIARNNRHTAKPCSIGRRLRGGAAASLFAASPSATMCSRPGPGLGPSHTNPCNYTAGIINRSGLFFVKRGSGPIKCP